VFCLGNSTFYAQFPTRALPMTSSREGAAIGLQSNALQPSRLLWETSTSRTTSDMTGLLRFNFSLGWEGYAYKVCVTARQAPVAPAVTAAAYFNTRCFYVVVPKCRKCFGPTDTLFDIAALYRGKWLDLWSSSSSLTSLLTSDEAHRFLESDQLLTEYRCRSVNSNLVNTTKANKATDEVFKPLNPKP